MEDRQEGNLPLRRAVELMTAWKNTDDASLIIELVSSDLGQALVEDRLVEKAGELIAGLMTLSALLLQELEQVTDESVASILQAAGWQAAGGEIPPG
jgi:hypothetical protein